MLIAKDGFVEYPPPRVFCQKSSDFLDYKGFGFFASAKEFATVSRERIYGAEGGRGVELT